ncbi:MAG TPA: sigma-70 family RNA polymerase sigma factor [Gemmataceae bacterium]|nr:sigma-70 family RNA polymerase sigma factor [Gemmataceae bacterium]
MLRPAEDPLIEGLAEGREEAFAVLYDSFAASLFRVAAGMLGSPQDAEDVVQEVFVAVFRGRRRLRQVENLRAYLFAALRRAAARRAAAPRRQRSLSPQELAEVSSPESIELDKEQAVRLERALRILPAEQREVIALKVDGGLTFAEIAVVLGIRANTAASRYRYGLEKLRAAMEA